MRALDPKKCSVWKRMQFEALDAMLSHLEGSLLRLVLASRLSIKHIHLVGGDWNIWIIFPYIGNFIIPTDFHIFQRGWNHQPDIVEPEIGTQKSFRPQDSCNVDSDSESFWIIDVLFPLVGWLIEGIRGLRGLFTKRTLLFWISSPWFWYSEISPRFLAVQWLKSYGHQWCRTWWCCPCTEWPPWITWRLLSAAGWFWLTNYHA